jgi:hypothetical protein
LSLNILRLYFLLTLAVYQNLPSFDPSKQKSSPSPKLWRFKNISDKRLYLRSTEAKRLNCTVDESFNDPWQICFVLFRWTGSIFILLNICLFAWDKLANDFSILTTWRQWIFSTRRPVHASVEWLMNKIIMFIQICHLGPVV